MAKHIFVTGGVVSSLGKGLTSAAIGMLLESRGLRVSLQKVDPYINTDAGTMSPFQHGEVYVTEDGAETDLDLGHYERFTSATMTRDSNFTTGTVYNAVITKERRGDFLGRTIQVVPHITDEIKERIRRLATPEVDVVITEIGGTVGDIEGLPFLEAIRQLRLDLGRGNVLYIHLTLVPYIRAAQEIKTKPTQHSVGRLREIGILPDIIICRTERPLTAEARDKISLFCNVDKEAVIEERDVTYSVYELPLVFIEQRLDQLIVSSLGLKVKKAHIARWQEIMKRIKFPEAEVKIAVIGKYIHVQSSYESIYAALEHAGIANNAAVKVNRVESENIEKDGPEAHLGDVAGILVPGGFGIRGSEGKVEAVRYARENKIPFFGICLGMQCATIEFARNVLGLSGANSSEFAPQTSHPVIDLMEEQKAVKKKGATMRVGAYPCHIKKGTTAFKAYGQEKISERHRHRYEFNNEYREAFEQKGFVLSGLSPDGQLVEMIELAKHPWFVAVQFHPEFQSRPVACHPLFRAFITAALKKSGTT